jgi:hypothetical protein
MENNLLRNSKHMETIKKNYLDVFKRRLGLHPPNWTKYVRVVGRIQLPFWREKGTCHETPQSICC